MYEILKKLELAPKIKLFEISASEIAMKAKAGQFVIFRVDEKGERIPLTLVDWEPKKGTITLIFVLSDIYLLQQHATGSSVSVPEALHPGHHP